jgi:hypothetical protein
MCWVSWGLRLCEMGGIWVSHVESYLRLLTRDSPAQFRAVV